MSKSIVQKLASPKSALALTIFSGFLVACASASSAQERAGRFAMSPVDGGFARLDTETGAMSICKSQPAASSPLAEWTCTPMAGSLTSQTQKLETENKELRAEIKRMEDLLGLNGAKPGTQEKQAERPGGGGLNLPSEQDVDKALSYMERMVKKFQDTMRRLEGKSGDETGRRGIAL